MHKRTIGRKLLNMAKILSEKSELARSGFINIDMLPLTREQFGIKVGSDG